MNLKDFRKPLGYFTETLFKIPSHHIQPRRTECTLQTLSMTYLKSKVTMISDQRKGKEIKSY